MNTGKQKLKIAVASGKGGVGKSMLTSCLAILFAKNYKVTVVDCDVDAPNLAIWLDEVGNWDKIEKISTSEKPVFDYNKCIGCGTCVSNCQFKALKMIDNKPKLNHFLCEGCGTCEILCSAKAIRMKPVKNGEIKIKKTKYGFDLFSGQLYPGEVGSGKIISELKEKADKEYDIMLIDSSPGTGCPVIASLQDTNFVVLITEPTPSGFSDLKRVLRVVDYFKIPYGVIINKWDINKPLSYKIKQWSGKKFLGQISYNQKIFQAISNLKPIMETRLETKKEINKIYNNLVNYLEKL